MEKIDANDILQTRGADDLFDEISKAGDQAAKETAATSAKIAQKAQNGASGTLHHDKTIEKEKLDASTALFQSFRTAATYFSTAFEEDRARRRKFAWRKTGFKNLDAEQVFTPGLYILGGLTGMGKTDFALQWAAQCVNHGEPVLYVSYEMDEAALRARCLANELYQRDSGTTLTATDIRFGGGNRTLEEIVAEQKTVQNFTIVRTGAGLAKLLPAFEMYVADLDKLPVIIIDYVQRIPPDENRVEKHEAISRAAYALKEWQLKSDSTIILLSAFNRDNYSAPVSEESFKWSGDLEYSADVLLGLQLYCVNGTTGKVIDDRKTFQRAKKHQPREMELVAVKNREGSPYNVYFEYFSAHSHFEPFLKQPVSEYHFTGDFDPKDDSGDTSAVEEKIVDCNDDADDDEFKDVPLPF